MFKSVRTAVMAGVLVTLTACTSHIESKKTTVATIICYTLQFLFIKLLAVSAQLPINNRNDCAYTKNWESGTDKLYSTNALSGLRSFISPISIAPIGQGNSYGLATKPIAS